MKTADVPCEDVAKELLDKLYGEAATHNDQWFSDRDCIAQALTAFADERVKEHEEELICEDCGYAGSRVKPYLAEARAEALEEAAKVAETVWDHVPSEEYDFEPGHVATQKEIAQRIRALKVKP